MTTANLFGMEAEFRLDQAADLVRGESPLAQFLNGRPYYALGATNFFDPIAMALVVHDEGAGAVAEFNDALPLEFRVRFDHCIGADHKLLRERSNAWQLVARSKHATLNRVPEAVHQLKVNGHARAWIHL
jgi:hypothetical protein